MRSASFEGFEVTINVDIIKFSKDWVRKLARRNHRGLVYVCKDPKFLYV